MLTKMKNIDFLSAHHAFRDTIFIKSILQRHNSIRYCTYTYCLLFLLNSAQSFSSILYCVDGMMLFLIIRFDVCILKHEWKRGK